MKYWHQGDDNKRLVPLETHNERLEWVPVKYNPELVKRVLHARQGGDFDIEPDVYKTPDGEEKIVGISFVAGRPKHSMPIDDLEIVDRWAAFITPSEFERLRSEMAQKVAKNLEAAVLAGSPYISDKPLPPAPKRSVFMRVGSWLRSQIARLRELFARDDGEGWDY